MIFLRACQNDVRKRYQSARELSSDLMLLQSGKSLRRVRALEQRMAAARTVALAAVLLVAAVAVANHLLQQRRLQRVEQEKALEAAAKRRAEGLFREQTQHLVDLHLATGDRFERDGDFFGALLWFSKALGEDPPDAERLSILRQRVESLRQRCPRMLLFFTHEQGITSAAFSADGERVLTVADPGVAQVWTALNDEPVVVRLDHPGAVRTARFSPTGRQVLTVSDGSGARI
ncbi:MAG: hypothetical protein DME25_22100 [Verrucomicrobia bacterium]|nr:MAG: hypothetical protein DME25_22100 [Verrucomicrobiota bacterium]